MIIPTKLQMDEASSILNRLSIMTEIIRKNAVEKGIDVSEAITKYHMGLGYSTSRLRARILMNGGFASFKCLFHGSTMIAWEKVSVRNGEHCSRMWSLMPKYAKMYGISRISAGKNSRDIRNFGFEEKNAMLPAYVTTARCPNERAVVRVDIDEMIYSGF